MELIQEITEQAAVQKVSIFEPSADTFYCDMREEYNMGIRTVRTEGDECLRKVCKPVKSVSLRTRILIEDMFDTMYESGGVGLAAPQIGVLKRIVVMDTDDNQHVLINTTLSRNAKTSLIACLLTANL